MTYREDISQFWGNQWEESLKGLNINCPVTAYKFDKWLRPILDQLPRQAKVCEIGSGNCQWLSCIRSYRPDLELFGVDLTDAAQRFAERFGIGFFQADIRKIPVADNFFDFTFSWGVIEHMLDSNCALKEQYRVSKTWVIADVPCKQSLSAIMISRAQKRRNMSDYEAMIEFGRIFTVKEFKGLIQEVCKNQDVVQISRNYCVIPEKKFKGYDIGSKLDRLVPSWIRKKYAQNIGAIIKKTGSHTLF